MWSLKNRWPAVSAVGLAAFLAVPGARSADGTGTMTVPPTAVAASGTASLTFTYTAPPDQSLEEGAVALDVPQGWTSPVSSGPGAVSIACVDPAGNCNVTKSQPDINGQLVEFDTIFLGPGQALTITYRDAAVQDFAGTATFTASEQSTAAGSLTVLPSSPQVTVTCADGTGSGKVSPGMVTAASTRTLTLTYTPEPGCTLAGGTVSLTVPSGWTPPSAVPGAAGQITASPAAPVPVVSDSTVTVTGLTLAAGQTYVITYIDATAPAAATTSTFDVFEQSTSTGSPVLLLASPQVTTELAKAQHSTSASPSNGPSSVASSSPLQSAHPPPSTGTMTVAPATVPASHPGLLTFTYQPPAGGLPAPGELTLTVPRGWTAPSTKPGRAGYTTSAPGALSVSARKIVITGLDLGPGQQLVITYRPAAAPRAGGRAVFRAADRSGGATVLTALTSSPSVMVAGPTVRPSPFHLPIRLLLVVLGAACVAGISAVRYLRHRPGTPPPPSVRAVPQAGPVDPAGPVTVDYSGTGVTRAVSIQPHPGAPVTTIEETRP